MVSNTYIHNDMNTYDDIHQRLSPGDAQLPDSAVLSDNGSHNPMACVVQYTLASSGLYYHLTLSCFGLSYHVQVVPLISRRD